MTREPDATAIGQFVEALFRYADEGTFVSLRAFDQHGRGTSPPYIRAVVINPHDLAPLITEAIAGARFAANRSEPVVFAPPVATFSTQPVQPRLHWRTAWPSQLSWMRVIPSPPARRWKRCSAPPRW
jgi:hypothetical protein